MKSETIDPKLAKQIDAFIEGALGESEAELLRSVLKADAVALAYYCEQVDLHARLEWEYGGIHAEQQLSPMFTQESKRPAVVPWAMFVGLAAVLCICLWVSFGSNLKAISNKELAMVKHVQGDAAIIQRGGKEEPAIAGSVLRLGDVLVTQQKGSVVIQYPDYSMLEVAASSEIQLNEKANGNKELIVNRGSVFCSINRQPDKQPMSFQTPQIKGKVKGTIFRINAATNKTRFQTIVGEVALKELGESEWTLVAEGQLATLAPYKELSVTELTPDLWSAGDVIWLQEFGNDFGASREGFDGFFKTLRDGMRTVSAIVSVPAPPDTPGSGWQPDQWITVNRYDDQPLVRISEEELITFKIRAEKEGYADIALVHHDKKIQAEHLIRQGVPLSTEWTQITLPATEFIRYRNSRPLGNGLLIQEIAFWGLDVGKMMIDRIVIHRKSDKYTTL